MFACANLARKWGIDPETALRLGNEKFEKRFRTMESMFTDAGIALKDTSLNDMEAAWDAVKQAEREAAE